MALASSAFADHDYFDHVTRFGNQSVLDSELAEGAQDGKCAIIRKHGSLTLDIGHARYFRDGDGDDVYVELGGNEPVDYTVYVRRAPTGGNPWVQVGRGSASQGFDMGHHNVSSANYIQIRNESHSPLRVDAVKAFFVVSHHH